LTDFGIDIDFKFAHFINDFSPNVWTESGITTTIKLVQL
jgi:hypothetical protein